MGDRGKESFVKLFTGTFDHVFGISVSTDTGTAWVKGIGWFDLAIAAVLTITLIGNLAGTGALYRFAYSPAAIVIYAWGALWGFLTAGSRVTAVGEFYPEVWDVVERAPNFVVPAVLIYMVYQHRLDHTPTTATTEALRATQPAARWVPIRLHHRVAGSILESGPGKTRARWPSSSQRTRYGGLPSG